MKRGSKRCDCGAEFPENVLVVGSIHDEYDRRRAADAGESIARCQRCGTFYLLAKAHA
jgi:hypothetical protein